MKRVFKNVRFSRIDKSRLWFCRDTANDTLIGALNPGMDIPVWDNGNVIYIYLGGTKVKLEKLFDMIIRAGSADRKIKFTGTGLLGAWTQIDNVSVRQKF